jgi:hypothetical protein
MDLVRFVVDKVVLEQVFLTVLQFPPLSIIPPMLLVFVHYSNTLSRTSGRSLVRRTFKEHDALADMKEVLP